MKSRFYKVKMKLELFIIKCKVLRILFQIKSMEVYKGEKVLNIFEMLIMQKLVISYKLECRSRRD